METTQQEILSRIDALAAKLNVAAEHLYGVMVQQGIIEGWSTIIYNSLIFLMFAVVFFFAYRFSIVFTTKQKQKIQELNRKEIEEVEARNEKERATVPPSGYYYRATPHLKDEDEYDGLPTIVGAVVLFGTLVIFSLVLSSILNGVKILMNPEWWALQELLKVLQ